MEIQVTVVIIPTGVIVSKMICYKEVLRLITDDEWIDQSIETTNLTVSKTNTNLIDTDLVNMIDHVITKIILHEGKGHETTIQEMLAMRKMTEEIMNIRQKEDWLLKIKIITITEG